MKRIGTLFLAGFIFVLSVFSVIPVDVYADDDKTVIPLVEGHFGLTESDAQSKVSAHKDIYYDNDQRAFAYTPSSSYNWTLCNSHGAVTSTHLSDKQVVALLCSSNRWEHNRTLISSFVSNNNIFRGFMSGVGSLFTGDSDNGTKFLDIVTGNYNYLDSLDYDEDSQTITMSNDNGSVDKLREEIKKYYYDYIGLKFLKPKGTVKELVNSSNFRGLFEYEEDYTNAYGLINSKYAFSSNYESAYFYNNKFADYYYLGNANSDSWNAFTDWTTNVYAYRLYSYDSNGVSSAWDVNNSTCSVVYNYNWNSSSDYTPNPSDDIPMWICPYYGQFVFEYDIRYSSAVSESWRYKKIRVDFYSADGSSFKYFKSYSALYNYLHGDQNAYLSNKIEETGQDISYSIKDMNENLGDKMDQLIDSINSKKDGLSADELQDLIDKGLDDLNKNTEDIKDNTSDILDILKEQNNILLQILGVTEYIAYNTQKDDGTDYTVSDLKNVFNTMYNGLGNAILYGKNTVTDSGSSAATQTARQSFKLSTAGAAASPDRAVVVYSADISTQDLENMDVHDGLFGKFPFSVPYQLYEWLQVLQADPVAPVFVYNYGFLLGDKNNPKYDLKIDLSIYQPWADQAKSFQRLAFTLLMALFIFHKFNGNTKGGNLS